MAEDAAVGWRCWEGALKVMAGNVTPIRVPNVVLLSWKKEPVDCITTAQQEQKTFKAEQDTKIKKWKHIKKIKKHVI